MRPCTRRCMARTCLVIRSASARAPKPIVLMTWAVRARRSYGSSIALECASSPLTASGWVACINRARGPESATARSRWMRRSIESSLKYPAAAMHLALVGALHLAAPRAGLGPVRLHELLEPLEVALDAAVWRADRVADLLDDALGHEIHLHHDPGLVLVEAVEGHDPGVVLAVGVAPGHT